MNYKTSYNSIKTNSYNQEQPAWSIISNSSTAWPINFSNDTSLKPTSYQPNISMSSTNHAAMLESGNHAFMLWHMMQDASGYSTAGLRHRPTTPWLGSFQHSPNYI